MKIFHLPFLTFSADLDAMETFPQHHQLQKNVLLTICSDRILQDVSSYSYTADQQMASIDDIV